MTYVRNMKAFLDWVCLSVRLFVRNDMGQGQFYRAKAGIETKNGVSLAEKRAAGTV